MSVIESSIRALSRDTFWGPFLVLAGLVVIYRGSAGLSNYGDTIRAADYVILGAGAFLSSAGVFVILRQLNRAATIVIGDSNDGGDDAAYVVRQLSRNFEILRAQTSQGFILSGVFMAIGLLIIMASLFAPSVGLKTQGLDTNQSLI